MECLHFLTSWCRNNILYIREGEETQIWLILLFYQQEFVCLFLSECRFSIMLQIIAETWGWLMFEADQWYSENGLYFYVAHTFKRHCWESRNSGGGKTNKKNEQHIRSVQGVPVSRWEETEQILKTPDISMWWNVWLPSSPLFEFQRPPWWMWL